MVAIDNGRFSPLPFKDMLDPATGRTKVRMVDVNSEYYKIASEYMARLSHEDFDDQEALARYAKVLNLTSEQFRTRFSSAVKGES